MSVNVSRKSSPGSRPERRIGRLVVLVGIGLSLVVGEVRGQEAQWESGAAAREVTLPEALSL
ncbi:MAG: hypothetical protein M8863_10315, partial [marine benthic group bacterium]|nr:hypothetical protein [Gemmatimonadota bacterium]